MDRRNYMELLSGQIRCKKALPLVTYELELHIEDQKSDFMAEGMTEREAEEAAVREMGNPVEVGAEMDRIHRPRMNWRMIAGIGMISLLGAGALYALDTCIEQKTAPFLQLSYLFYMFVGYIAMIGVCYLDYTRIAHRAKELLAAYIILLGGGTVFSGTTVNGARAFISLSGMTIGISCMVLLAIPLYCAVLYSFRGQGYKGLLKGVLWMLPILAMQAALHMAELIILVPVLMVILSAAVCKQYFRVSVAKTLTAVWGGAVLLTGTGLFVIIKSAAPYQRMRLKAMATGEGEQFYNLKKLLEGSSFIGQGADFSEVSGGLPDSSGFALSYIMACFGVLAATCTISVIAILLFKLTAMTVRQRNRLGFLMGTGCAAAVGVPVVWYVLTNMGVIRMGYAYCPFITSGGTRIVVTYILFGIMLSIYRYQDVAAEEWQKVRIKGKLPA